MASLPPTANLIGSKLGNYRLERLLGRGRMGVVYLARDEALLRPIALKLIAWSLQDAHHHDPEAWLLAEARNIARVNHPAVIQVHAVARSGPHAYIAMEYVDGISADQFAAERGSFTPAAATQILLQIASALQAAHECGVIHRDVKPANILIRHDGLAKLGDFGMAIHRHAPPVLNGEHQVGTPLYTAPELWSGSPATPSTDLYALGATYHFLLTGHPPFETSELSSLIEAHRHQPPRLEELASRLPAACIDVLRRCLAKSPAERVASAQELSWRARGALRDIEGQRREARRSSMRATMPSHPDRRDSLHHTLGLDRSPFRGGGGTGALAALGSFSGVVAELRAAFDEAGSVVHLAHADGSAARLLRELARPPHFRGPIAWLEADGALGADSLARRACRAFGALPSAGAASDNALEGVLEHLAKSTSDPALLVVESSAPARTLQRELEPLVAAARASRYFSIVLVAPSEAGAALPGAETVRLPTLSRLELLEYLRTCLSACQTPTSPPLLITPDAALIVYHYTAGDITLANRTATRMLEIAAVRGARVLTSLHAWLATRAPDAPLPSPEAFPTPEVLSLLAEERAAAGIDRRQEM